MVRRQLSQAFGAEPNAESVDGRAGWRGPTVPQNQPDCRWPVKDWIPDELRSHINFL